MRIQPDKFKHWRDLPGYFSAFVLMPVVLALLAGCAQLPRHGGQRAAPSQPLARMEVPVSTATSKVLALRVKAEFALQNNDVAVAAEDYAAAAKLSPDPAVARRALQLALSAGAADAARSVLARWQQLGASPAEVAGASARLAMLQGNRDEAERQFRRLLGSGTAAVWKTFAADLFSARDSALAGRILETLATPGRLPADAGVWVALSQLGEHLGRHAFARELAEAAVHRFGGADTVRWAASLQVAAGDRSGALALYAKGMQTSPHDVSLRLGYAALLGDQGKYHKALGVLADGPQTSATWSSRVALAARAHDQAALARVYTGLTRAPAEQRDANGFLLGQVAELLQRDHEALAWYAKVDPDSRRGFEAQVRRAVLLNKVDQTVQAHAVAAQLQRDYADVPDNLRTAFELDAQLYSQRGEHASAIDVYDRALAVMPDDRVLVYDRGIELANAGKTNAALAAFRKVLKLDPGNVEAMNALGFTLADADRDLAEATRLLDKALAARPDAASIMDSWGWLQYRLGNLDQAKTWLERAWDKQKNAEIGVHLGEVLWKLGQQQRARAVFAQVRKADPGNLALQRAERRLLP